ncbi:hypothetical protein [Methylobacterium sp. Leaf399]|uniref:hypothetical protein n=1 Tax=Methylobacterium sp. Leaf399 TaxID=1736364 RepID=UPI001FCDC383|nr:hypothetical protein [Methylobacterium sp. Leaf399]
MPQLQFAFAPSRSNPGLAPHLDDPFVDHLAGRAGNRLHREPAPTRVIEIGEVTAGIAVPEHGGVRFFSSRRDFDPLDGTVFPSVEQAARAVRTRFRARTRPQAGPGGQGLRAV